MYHKWAQQLNRCPPHSSYSRWYGLALLSTILSRLTCAPPSSQPKAVSGKSSTAKHKFVIDYSRPANDEVFDGADFEKYMHDHIKVDGKAGQLGENVKVARDGTLRTICFIIILDCLLLQRQTQKSP